LFDEIKKRLLEFDKRIKKTRTELADEIFNKSIDHIVDVDEVYDELCGDEDDEDE